MSEFNPWEVVLSTPHLNGLVQAGEIVPLFACESGSRAWDIESEDSDYDVRWVYIRTPRWYLSLAEKKDVIETRAVRNGREVDAAGWDLRKFLGLTKKSNASPFEWVFSCPSYYYNSFFRSAAHIHMPYYFNPVQLAYHYRGMANKHWYRYVVDQDEVHEKKFLYLLRAVWMVEWYLSEAEIRDRGLRGNPEDVDIPTSSVAPGSIFKLMAKMEMPQSVEDLALDLISRKINGDELGFSEPNEVLEEYIAGKLDQWKNGFGIAISGSPGWERLDAFFMYCLHADFDTSVLPVREQLN